MADTPDPTDAQTSVSGEHDPYAVLRNRDFRLYLTGRLVATIGQQMFAMALGWELYERTHSALALGFVGLTQVLPMILCTLPAGHFADIYNRKRIIVLMTLIVAAANIGLAVISAATAPVLLIYLCLVVTGTARTFLWAASASFLPQLVERKDLSRAVTWSSSMFQLSSIVGPSAAGAVLHFTHHAAGIYAINAVAAVVCSILIGRVHQHHVAVVKEKTTLKTLLTGFSFVFTNRIILGIITLDMFAVLLGGATALLPIYAKDILFVGPYGLGLLQAALPLGAIICSFVVAHRPPMQKAGRSLLWAVTVFGLATIGFGFSHWFWLSFGLLFTCGAADNVSVVVRHTLVQLLTPNEKRGRVSAVNNLFIGTANEMGEFESGTVAQWFGPALGNTIAFGAMVSVVSGGIGTIFVVLGIAWFWPEIRKYGRLDA
jgi:MFS family permease